MKKHYPVIATLISGILLFSLFGCGATETDWHEKDEWLKKGEAVPTAEYVLPENVNFAAASVHDPSVFHDPKDGRYYAFGSHFAVASTADFISWKQDLGDGAGSAAKLFGNTNWRNVLKKADDHSGGNENVWAPDVEYINGKYYMYFSLTSGFGSNRSFIGRVEASNVLGPYSNEVEIVKTEGGSGQPNAIDPELFYDKTGKLWMVYGSFFAGIYIKELDKNGLPVVSDPDAEDYYGKLLWKGAGGGVEGPFIFYNAETDYYYLMTSDGSLRNDDRGRPPRQGNYNMRVARSKNPDGPYEDIAGKDMASAYGGGNKLAGNWQFAGSTGFGAMGHNSVVKVDGKYLVIAHVRTRETGDEITLGHNIDVHQLFFNEDGWPVLAPNRYGGESAGRVAQDKIAGDYDIIVHTTGSEYTFADSQKYTLSADGKVTGADGADAGTWELKQDFYFKITLGGTEYSGVAAPGWRNYGTRAGILTMTAVSGQGGSIWLNAAAAQA